MATERTILRLGKRDEGRFVISEEFEEAEFDEPWKYEREDGRLFVLPPSGEGHIDATEPWLEELIFYKSPPSRRRPASRSRSLRIRVEDGTDRIGDIGVFLNPDGPVPKIPDRVPDLMFEVVSPNKNSRDRDDIRKRAEYYSLGVKEYVIIDRFRRVVVVSDAGTGRL